MASEERCFTFDWQLENISYCLQKNGEELRSPVFVVAAIEGTKWSLQLYPRGYSKEEIHVAYYLHREEDNSEGIVEIKYELAFVGVDIRDRVDRGIIKRLFSKGAAFGHRNVPIVLTEDILTLRCKIWKGEGEMAMNVKCIALTRVGVEKISSNWDVRRFSSLELEKKRNHQIKSIQNHLPLMSVDLSLIGEPISQRMIRFDLSLLDKTIKLANLRLFRTDSSGKRLDWHKEEMWFDHPNACKQLTFNFLSLNLLERKGFLFTQKVLPNDTFSLIWEWVFSKGVVTEEPLSDVHGCICSKVKNSSSENQKYILNDFADDVKCLYDERFLSDVKLKTETSEFPAHKFMLSVSSSVFKAMFFHDMKEKIDGCVCIDDLDGETLSRMLHFIYYRRVGDLSWESAKDLYVAAYKYDILNLKKVCSSILKKNLSRSNACDVLLLADSHADTDLKSYVQDYVIENAKQITTSDEWKSLMEANLKLAAETLCGMFN